MPFHSSPSLYHEDTIYVLVFHILDVCMGCVASYLFIAFCVSLTFVLFCCFVSFSNNLPFHALFSFPCRLYFCICVYSAQIVSVILVMFPLFYHGQQHNHSWKHSPGCLQSLSSCYMPHTARTIPHKTSLIAASANTNSNVCVTLTFAIEGFIPIGLLHQ